MVVHVRMVLTAWRGTDLEGAQGAVWVLAMTFLLTRVGLHGVHIRTPRLY